MFQGSSTPACLSIFSIISAIRFSMINLIREVLRGENQVGISRIKNTWFPEMHNFSILFVSMISSAYMPLEFDSRNLQNPEHSIEIPIPSEKMHGKGNIPAYNGFGSSSHVLSSTGISAVEKSGSCKVGLGIIISSLANSAVEKLASCKVGLGIIINSPAEEAEPFDNKVKCDFPKLLGSSVEINVTSENKVDHAPISPSSFHEPFHPSSVNLTNTVSESNVDVPNEMTNISGQDVTIPSGRQHYVHPEWPCVFAVNQNFDSVTRGPLFTNSTGFLNSQPLTICIKHRNAGFLALEEIENTDNYTRRTNYLPYPKVTHMYNNCILEFPPKPSTHGNFNKKKPSYPLRVHNPRRWSLLSANENFLKNCETCNKSLEGIDIYIYRGESAFCSLECRYWKVKAERNFARITKLITIPPPSSNTKAIFYYGAKPGGA